MTQKVSGLMLKDTALDEVVTQYTSGNYLRVGSNLTPEQRTPAQALSDLGLAYGTYTPTSTNVLNLDSSTPHSAQWLRVGNTVTVSGTLLIDATAAGSTQTQVRLTLPVASALTDTNELAGAGCVQAPTYMPVGVTGGVLSDTAVLEWGSQSTASHTLTYTYTYRVL